MFSCSSKKMRVSTEHQGSASTERLNCSSEAKSLPALQGKKNVVLFPAPVAEKESKERGTKPDVYWQQKSDSNTKWTYIQISLFAQAMHKHFHLQFWQLYFVLMTNTSHECWADVVTGEREHEIHLEKRVWEERKIVICRGRGFTHQLHLVSHLLPIYSSAAVEEQQSSQSAVLVELSPAHAAQKKPELLLGARRHADQQPLLSSWRLWINLLPQTCLDFSSLHSDWKLYLAYHLSLSFATHSSRSTFLSVIFNTTPWCPFMC